MRLQHFVFSALVCVAACNSKPQAGPSDNSRNLADSLRLAEDTAGLAAFQAQKAQNELGTQDPKIEKKEGSSPSTRSRKSTGSSSSSASSETGGTASSSSGTEAQAKKGWSKTAKGAVIGGVVGAGTGAIINKKNRAAGAVVGGVVGAGAGAIIGHEMDKKDGRH